VHPASRSLIGRWIYAAKLDSWPKLLVPMLFGQALGVAAAGRLDLVAFGLGLAFTICELLFVVFLNDWGDRRVDRIKRQMFPDDCSPKTIPDEILPASALLTAGVIAGVAALGLAMVAQQFLAALGLQALFLAYTFGPLRLNYRGGGEWLEGVGVGIALPCFHLVMQSGGSVWVRELWLVPGFFLLAIASAIASGLSDEQSDRRGGKRTYASEYGNRAARALVERLVLAACLIWAVSMRISGVIPGPIGALAVIVILVNWRRLRAVSPEAKTNAFVAQRRYKHYLHQAQWRSAALISIALVILTLVGWHGWHGWPN
jgi:1,4-dihydroxy-2-naphthoate octaprenyltransferase/chlorophyll synthase